MIAAIIQARVGSSRLRNKIFKKVGNLVLLKLMISRVRLTKRLDNIIICTTNKKEDNKIVNFSKKYRILYHRGSSSNVMKRYVDTVVKFQIKTIVRLTSDCPLIDPEIIDKMINIYNFKNTDYFSNTCPPENSRYPNGSDVEIFETKTIKKIINKEKRKVFLEHVTHNFWKEGNYKIKILNNNENWSNFRYTLDDYNDFLIISCIIKHFKSKIYKVNTNKIIKFLKSQTFIKKQKLKVLI